MAFQKPDWLRSGLTTGWLNVWAGEWVNITIPVINYRLRLPPFDFLPGYWIEWAVDTIIGWLNWVDMFTAAAFNAANDALISAWEALTKINNWLLGAPSWFSQQISGWWGSTWAWLSAWVLSIQDWLMGQINYAFQLITGLDVKITNLIWDFNTFKANFIEELKRDVFFATLIDIVNTASMIVQSLPRELWEFFADPAGWIFERIDDWLNEEVSP